MRKIETPAGGNFGTGSVFRYRVSGVYHYGHWDNDRQEWRPGLGPWQKILTVQPHAMWIEVIRLYGGTLHRDLAEAGVPHSKSASEPGSGEERKPGDGE